MVSLTEKDSCNKGALLGKTLEPTDGCINSITASDLQKSDVKSFEDVRIIVLGVGCANCCLKDSRQVV